MRRAITFATIAVLLTTALPAASASPSEHCPAGTPDEATTSHESVKSFDGVEIAFTVFRPGDVCAEATVPVILHGHGWSGSRHTEVAPDIAPLLEAGYGVVSIDARGHGESGGQASVMHPDVEVHDYRAILDWIHDELDWVTREGDPADKDIVVGGIGGSYGGGFQLMTSAFDDRFDALVPQITWNDLAHSLAPNGVPRTVWTNLLTAVGLAFADIDPRLPQWHAEATVTGEPPEDAEAYFTETSPATWMDQIDVPALIVQGLPDTLFDLNEAVRNYVGIAEKRDEVWLFGFHGGHVLDDLQPTGFNDPVEMGREDCGDLGALILDFFDAHLKGDAAATTRMSATPRVSLPTEQGECVTGDAWPVHDVDLDIELPIIVAPQQAGSLFLPALSAEEETTIAGIPTLRGETPTGLDDVYFVSLVVQRGDGFHVVNDQVTPIRTDRLTDDDGMLEVELAGVTTTLQPGDQLHLRIDGVNEWFAAAMSRTPGLALLTDPVLTLPVVDQAVPEDDGDVDAAPDPGDEEGTAGPLPATGGGSGAAAVALMLAALAGFGVLRRTGRSGD